MFKKFIYVFAALSCTLLAYGQPASVTGVISDLSGAVVKDAKIILHRTSGSSTMSANSDSSGRFSFEEVAPGAYLLEVGALGLTLNPVQDLALVAGERKELKLQLSVSALTTLVSVTSSGAPQSIDQVAKALDVVDVNDAEQRGIFSCLLYTSPSPRD